MGSTSINSIVTHLTWVLILQTHHAHLTNSQGTPTYTHIAHEALGPTQHSQYAHIDSQKPGKTFTLGYITGSERRPEDLQYKRPGLIISGAITLAVDEVNSAYPLVSGHRLNFTVAETYGQEEESILQTAQLWISNISAYIGPQETCVHEARMAAAFNLPMISYFCTHPETSDKTDFPTFARTRPPDTQISKSVTSLLKRFNWRKVTFFYNNSPDENFGRVAQTIERTLPLHNITIITSMSWSSTYHHGYDTNPFVNMLMDTYMDCRIYVVLGHYYEFLGLMTIMEEKGLFKNGEYFVVGVTLSQYDQNKPDKYLRDLLNEHTNSTVQTAFQNFLGVLPSPSPSFEQFATNVNDYLERPPFNHPNAVHQLGGMKNIRAEAAYLYDAVHVYARALNESLRAGKNPHDGRALIASIFGSTYRSAMGYMVRMDERGDAEGNYTLIGRMAHHNTPGQFGLYPVAGFRYTENDYKGLPEVHLINDILWKTGVPPIDEPPCGYRGHKCQSQTGEIIAGVTGGVVLFLLVIVLVAYRNWRYEQELDSLLWKIDYKDIQINECIPNHTPAGTKLSRGLYSTVRTSQLSLGSNPDLDFRYQSVYTQLGLYRGRVVAVKHVSSKAVDITRRIKKELKTVRDLHHDNLLGFIGACVDPPNVCIVTEYCSRGSLKDILENEDVKLDSMFIASLIGDIVQGMVFLHDCPVKSHGNLKTSNCLVDSRWVVKISDFGLHGLKSGSDCTSLADAAEAQRMCTDLLYRAPELLRDSSAPPTGTQKADVYSFAIILYEVHGRNGPWGLVDQSPVSIIRQVMAIPYPMTSPVRPPLDGLGQCEDCVRTVLNECWAEIPEDRPDFRSIRTKLRPLRKGMKPNIFDNMLAMMEKYANNLEALVDERTHLLIEEKKKTEALLYKMLPRYVADQLKRGHKVEAESFDLVTIYFSDIVGFTEMSAESTPLQVVDFLNDLYTCFDSIIGHYDVYKVETIGDAYMVVSGLPIRNEDQHAGEVASMSIHLLDAIKKFKIRHRPYITLKLRIGLHSGPVCAGVVGLKMPRYCLFGDTVNTASRMESTGQALRIHCSVTCRNILVKLGGYVLEERGQVKVKGKGDMTTYWLIGEDPDWRRRREKRRRQRGLQLSKNGFPGGVKASTHCVKDSPVFLVDSPCSAKRLRFAVSEELRAERASVEEEDEEEIPGSPASDDIMLRRTKIQIKRHSCPCIKEHSRFQAKHSISSPSKMHQNELTLAQAKSSFSPTKMQPYRENELPLITQAKPTKIEVSLHQQKQNEQPLPQAKLNFSPTKMRFSLQNELPLINTKLFSGTHSPSSSAPSGEDAASRRTSLSEVASRPPSYIEAVGEIPTSAPSTIDARRGSLNFGEKQKRMSLGGPGVGRWLPHGTVSSVRRGSTTDEGGGAEGGRRFKEGENEESAPLLSGVAGYRVVNDMIHRERETPV